MISHHKITHNEWLNKAILSGIAPPKQVVELAWELLIAYGDFADNQADFKEDVYKIAYDIANIALEDKLPMIRVYEVYRDYLLEAMMNMSVHYVPEKPQQLVRFANIVSTAFCEAHTDRLKREIRHKRNENLVNELKIAKSIQRHLMPKQYLKFLVLMHTESCFLQKRWEETTGA